MDNLKRLIREAHDFPKPGILFYDLTTLLKDADGLRTTLDALHAPHVGKGIDIVAGIEARGFFFAPAVAAALHAGFVPIRKRQTLPAAVEFDEYALEHGSDGAEYHVDA